MCHSLRRHLADAVAAELAPWEVHIAEDDELFAPHGTLRTSRKAWAMRDEDASHKLVLQDDVVLSDDFRDQVAAVLEALPGHAVAFHADWRSRNGMAARLGLWTNRSYVDGLPDFVPCQALLLPAEVAEGFVRFTENWADPDEGDDDVMRKYLTAEGVPLAVAAPSAVEHRRVASLSGNDSHGVRAAAVFSSDAGLWRSGVPRSLELPDTVPLLQGGRLLLYRRSGDAAQRLRRTHEKVFHPDVVGFLTRDARSYVDGFGRHMSSRLREGRALEDLLSSRVLFDVWLFGATLRELCGIDLAAFDDRGSASSRALSRRAVETAVIGGLFPVLTHDRLAEVAPDLADIAFAGNANW